MLVYDQNIQLTSNLLRLHKNIHMEYHVHTKNIHMEYHVHTKKPVRMI